MRYVILRQALGCTGFNNKGSVISPLWYKLLGDSGYNNGGRHHEIYTLNFNSFV